MLVVPDRKAEVVEQLGAHVPVALVLPDSVHGGDARHRVAGQVEVAGARIGAGHPREVLVTTRALRRLLDTDPRCREREQMVEQVADGPRAALLDPAHRVVYGLGRLLPVVMLRQRAEDPGEP